MTNPWIQLRNGTKFDLINFDNNKFPSPQEMAYALSNLNRFTGHASQNYSVAAHSLNVLQEARAIVTEKYGHELSYNTQFFLLTHDAHECILGDISAPIKKAIPQIKSYELALQSWFYAQWNLWPNEDEIELIRYCDMVQLASEAAFLMAEPPEPWVCEGLIWEEDPILHKSKEEVESTWLAFYRTLKLGAECEKDDPSFTRYRHPAGLRECIRQRAL